MKNRPINDDQWSVEAIDAEEAFGRCSRSGAPNHHWRAFAPMLAVAFAALISSCDNASEKTDAENYAAVDGVLDVDSEDLLGRAKITAVAAEAVSEKVKGRDLDCIVKISNLNKEKNARTVEVLVPVSGKTYAERKKEAESPDARKRVAKCYQELGFELPPQLAAAEAESPVTKQSLFGIGAAHADNGTCLKPHSGSCGGAGVPPNCCR